MAQKRTGGTGRNRGRQPSIRFPKFMELPLEIRIQIYGWIFPNGALLHILAGGVPTLYPCICEETENKSYKLQSSAITSEADSENALRVGPRQDPTHTYNAHRSCNRGIMCGRFRQCFLDMRLLSVSREVRAEAAKQLWSTNTFSFDYPSCPSVLLAKVPLDLWSHIRFVRLEMWMEGRASDPTSSTAKWADCLAGLSRDMTGLRSLHLAIYLNDFVTCCERSRRGCVTDCDQPVHDLHAHDAEELTRWDRVDEEFLDFWRRREIRRRWAEGIRTLVLNKELSVEGRMKSLSIT